MIPIGEIRDLLPKAADAAAGLSQAEFNWRPAPGAWSVAECLAHLNVTDELYSVKIAAAIASARRAGVTGAGPFQLGWLETQFLRFMEPPSKMRFKSPKEFTPAAEHNIDRVLDSWRRTRLRLLKLAAEAEGLHLTKIRVQSPATALIQVSLLGAFGIAAAHDRRHLWQAGRIRSMLTPAVA